MSPAVVGGAIFLLASGASMILTDIARRYAVRKAIVDVPNERSLHSQPTPRGGGVAIALVVFVSIGGAWAAGLITSRVVAAFLGGGGAVALIGWWDDRHEIPAAARILVHFMAAGWALYWLGGFPSLDLGGRTVNLGLSGSLIAAIAIVWLINLYNFMDGSDGLAGAEAVCVALVGAGILFWSRQNGLALISLAIAGAAIGFLIHNWSPARIFMGDVGSGLLGFLFAALAIAADRQQELPLLAWVILLGVFVMDATVTLVRRVSRGERWYAAHRTHAYQRLAQTGWTHGRIAAGVCVLNFVLSCLAVVAVIEPELLLLMVASAACLLALLYLRIEKLAPFQPRSSRARD